MQMSFIEHAHFKSVYDLYMKALCIVCVAKLSTVVNHILKISENRMFNTMRFAKDVIQILMGRADIEI